MALHICGGKEPQRQNKCEGQSVEADQPRFRSNLRNICGSEHASDPSQLSLHAAVMLGGLPPPEQIRRYGSGM